MYIFLQTHMCVRLFICIIIYLSILYIRTFVPFYNGLMFLDSRLSLSAHSIITYRIYYVQSYHIVYMCTFFIKLKNYDIKEYHANHCVA